MIHNVYAAYRLNDDLDAIETRDAIHTWIYDTLGGSTTDLEVTLENDPTDDAYVVEVNATIDADARSIDAILSDLPNDLDWRVDDSHVDVD
jgi:cell division protein FtsX